MGGEDLKGNVDPCLPNGHALACKAMCVVVPEQGSLAKVRPLRGTQRREKVAPQNQTKCNFAAKCASSCIHPRGSIGYRQR